MAHDLLSPSSAHCWMICPGAVALGTIYGNGDDSSVYAEEGTAAHVEAERAAKAWFESTTYFPTTEDAEMIEHARGWAKMLGAHLDVRNLAFWATERALPVGVVTNRPGAKGTADFLAIDANGLLTIADFKYGMGVEVEAEKNPQLSIYALAAIEEFGVFQEITGVRLIIYQPRISAHEKTYEWNMEELADFGKRVRACADKAQSLIGHEDEALKFLNPGESQCRFCKAKANCPALMSKTRELIAADFEVLPAEDNAPKLPETADQLARVLPWLQTIEKWCDAVRAKALALLMDGEKIEGFKIVAGRKGPRKWGPGAEEALNSMRIRRDVLYTRALISPAQAERAHKDGLIGPRQWNAICQLITQSDGKPAIAPVFDARPAISVSTRDEFDVIEETK